MQFFVDGNTLTFSVEEIRMQFPAERMSMSDEDQRTKGRISFSDMNHSTFIVKFIKKNVKYNL